MTMHERAVTALAGLEALETFAEPVDLLSYRRDCSVVPAGQPDLVARPRDSAEVAEVIRRANADAVPIYVRGGGTMYAGGANPHAGGIVLDLAGMDRVLELDLARGIVVVEPGIRFGRLLDALKPHGQTVGIVPVTGPTATVGGAVSSHALGSGSPRHQSIGDCVAGLEVVLADGSHLRTGSAAVEGAGFFQRYCVGPDLTGLFIGGDATFGVITAVALWLYPLPEARQTCCFGFPDAAAAGRFVTVLQARELTRNLWYAAGYEAGTIRARVAAARPTVDANALPGFCIGVEIGADTAMIDTERLRLLALAEEYDGDAFDLFDEIYFNTLRFDQAHWYSYAGYFAQSRCAVLMTSLPADRLAGFVSCVGELRAHWNAFTWGAAVVVCRRGLHGGVITFYDERSQWQAVAPAIDAATRALIAAGCVPYKSGKLWADRVREQGAYWNLLDLLKRGIDPRGILSPGNLGLGEAS